MTKEELSSAQRSGQTAAHPGSERAQQHAAMLEAAQARPGIREVMQVHRDWQEKDSGIDAYRSATKTSAQTLTTNRANIA